MKLPDLRNLSLDGGVLPEPTPDGKRIVFWLPEAGDEKARNWKRISNIADADIQAEQGLCAVAAQSIQARQPIRGLFGKLFRRSTESGSQSWMLPNGESAEQVGERRLDLLLVWAEDDAATVDEARIKSQWPESKQITKIGKTLFVAFGVQSQEAVGEAEPARRLECPTAQAEQIVTAARQRGEPGALASALLDLGALYTRQNQGDRAAPPLQEALEIARRLGDRSKEADALDNLGLIGLASGQAQQAQNIFEQAVARAREAGDRFTQKTALYHLGLVFSNLRQNGKALEVFAQSLALAREVGDRPQQADILWYTGIQHAELGQREQAIAYGQATVDLLHELKKPEETWYAEYLQRYRMGDRGLTAAAPPVMNAAMMPGGLVGGTNKESAWMADPVMWTGEDQNVGGPGLLRMAYSLAKSAARFVGTGLKTVPSKLYQKRIRTCKDCEHHTGLRCKICGCFTSAKAWIPHEQCPIGKWPG